MNTAFGANGEATSAMNPIFGDYEQRRLAGSLCLRHRYHRLFHNPGPKGFWLDTTVETGVAAVSGQYVAWGDGFYDYDNDGWKDLFIVNGGLHWLIPMEDSLLRNNGDSTFTTCRRKRATISIQESGAWRCFGDYDNDGYTDVFIVTLGGKGILLHAKPPASGARNHWLTFKLVGTKSDRDGFGASLEAVTGTAHQYIQAVSENGYLSQGEPRPHLAGPTSGSGQAHRSSPSGTEQVLEHVKADQILTVTEPDGADRTKGHRSTMVPTC